jgi:hypothetical protein
MKRFSDAENGAFCALLARISRLGRRGGLEGGVVFRVGAAVELRTSGLGSWAGGSGFGEREAVTDFVAGAGRGEMALEEEELAGGEARDSGLRGET